MNYVRHHSQKGCPEEAKTLDSPASATSILSRAGKVNIEVSFRGQYLSIIYFTKCNSKYLLILFSKWLKVCRISQTCKTSVVVYSLYSLSPLYKVPPSWVWWTSRTPHAGYQPAPALPRVMLRLGCLMCIRQSINLITCELNICASFNSPWELLCISLFNYIASLLPVMNYLPVGHKCFCREQESKTGSNKSAGISVCSVFTVEEKMGGWKGRVCGERWRFVQSKRIKEEGDNKGLGVWQPLRLFPFIKTFTSPTLCLYVLVHVHDDTILCIGRKMLSV